MTSNRQKESFFCLLNKSEQYMLCFNSEGRHQFSDLEVKGMKKITAMQCCGLPTNNPYSPKPQKCNTCPPCTAELYDVLKRKVKKIALRYPSEPYDHFLITMHIKHVKAEKFIEKRDIAISAIKEAIEQRGIKLGIIYSYHVNASDMSPAPHIHFLLSRKCLVKRRRADITDLVGGVKTFDGVLRTIWTGIIGVNDPESVLVETVRDFDRCLNYMANGIFSKIKLFGDRNFIQIKYMKKVNGKYELRTMKKTRAYLNMVHSLGMTYYAQKIKGYGFYSMQCRKPNKELAFLKSGIKGRMP